MKVFSEESALQLSEMLLQNDKDIKTEIEGKIPSVDGLATEIYVNNAIANAQLSGGDTNVDLSGYATKDDLNGYATKEHTHNEYLTEHQDLSDYAKKTDIPTTLPASDVYDWAKAETKPEYTADEVGALPNTTVIPSIEGLASKEYVDNALGALDVVTPNLTIGTVETLEAGTSATATITGDKGNPVLNLGIPKGADGYTPVKGTDYWTTDDKAEIQSYIDTQIGGALNGSY